MATIAEGLSSDSNFSGRTWLRVKRKRTDDAIEALVVEHRPKRSVHEKADSDAVEGALSKVTFHFAGTVSDNQSIPHDVLERVHPQAKAHSASPSTKRKALYSSRSRTTSLSEVQRRSRDHRKTAASKGRYRLVSRHRKIDGPFAGVGDEQRTSSLTAKEGQHPSSSPDVTLSCSEVLQEEQTAEDEEVSRIFQVYDVIKGDSTPDSRRSSCSIASDIRTDDVLCNTTRMLRERLFIRDGATPGMSTESDEYVYDIYYAEDNVSDMSDRVQIEPFVQEYVNDIGVSDEEDCYEDEDDSNDEDNWRNDYPEENSYGSDGRHSDSSDDDDLTCLDHGIRYRSTDRYDHRTHGHDGDDEDDSHHPYDWFVRNAPKLNAAVDSSHDLSYGGYSHVAYDPDLDLEPDDQDNGADDDR